MDALLRSIRELKEETGFKGKLSDFKGSETIIKYCIKNGLIAKGLSHSSIENDLREKYFQHLLRLTKDFLQNNKAINSWEDLEERTDCSQAAKILFSFGVRGEILNLLTIEDNSPKKSPTFITIEELHELCKIKFNYKGSISAFKSYLQKEYGSYAEYCLQKGYDINTTKWETPESAIRCAKKIGCLDAVKVKSISLYKYLEENNLLYIFSNRSSEAKAS
jgi:hypothetical protein